MSYSTASLYERIERAVVRGRTARSRFYASIELDDEQAIGGPADEKSLMQLQRLCGRALPPSYWTFLRLHDGWSMVDGGCDLLSVGQLLSPNMQDRVRRWQDAMAQEGQDALAEGLVIGWSFISQKRIVLDLGAPDPSGECRLIQWDADEFLEYDDFLSWLEESAQEFEEISGLSSGHEDDR